MANKDLTIRIKVQDGQAKVQIEQIGKGFMSAKNAADLFTKAIQDQNPVLKGSVADYERQIRALKLVRNNSAKTAEEFDRQTKAIVQLQQKQRALTINIQDFNKVNQDQISNAGLAGATLTELGRTISDLPYGIRGVANNLSQLSTLFITLVSKTDGVANSFKTLLNQLRGPLGIILAFQAVIALLDFFAQKSDKAKDSTDDLTESMSEELIVLRELNDAIDQNIIKREEALNIAKGFLKTDKELKKILEDTTLSEEERGEKIVELLKKREEELVLEEKIKALRKEIAEAEVGINEAIEQREIRVRNLGEGVREINGIQYNTLEDLRKFTDESNVPLRGLAEANNEVIGLQGEQAKRIKELVDLMSQLNTVTEEGVEPTEKRAKVEPLDLSLLTDGKDIKLYKEMVIGMTEDQLMAVAALAEQGKIGADAFAKFVKAFLAEQKRIADEAQQTLEREVERNKQLLAIYESFKQSTDALFEAEISREERRTVLKNNELRKQLKNEQLTAQQREAINSQIVTNEENLDRKRDKIAERQFKIQKALMIGEALVTTYRMANSAYQAVLVSPLKFLGITALAQAKIAAGIATAFGLANVAAIARQQFVPSAIGGAGGGGAGGAGGGIQAPDFNIVGASAQSQLAETVATAESQPVRAFVVGKDISTQQELDRNISDTASFG
jgi:hypothetical protein